jgi:hypothetical protein
VTRIEKSKTLVLALATGLLCSTSTMSAEFHCAEDGHVIAACLKIHGRLTIPANSRPEIWEIGTRRVFGLQYPEDLPSVGGELIPLPEGVTAILENDPSSQIFGDFTICPYTPAKSGQKQYACIERAERIVARPERVNPRPPAP